MKGGEITHGNGAFCYYIYAMYFLDMEVYIILQAILVGVFNKKCMKCCHEAVV